MTKLLVIEDEIGIRDSIVDILQAEDYIVESAPNGEDGLRMIDEFHPDLVLCDIMMPILDGHEVLQKIRQNPSTKTLPFIFLTAKADKVDFREGMDLGANDYITKPFTHDELLSTIQTRLGLKEAAQQEVQKQLEVLRTSINTSLPREIGTHLEEIITLSQTLTEKADMLPSQGIVGLGKAIHHNAHQVARLIEKLMFSAQLENLDPDSDAAIAMRQQRTQKADKIVCDVAQQIAQDYLREADLELSVELASVQMGSSNFQKVCQELIANAFKFSKEGSPVKVVCSHQEQSLVFYIIDYGKGMTAEEIERSGAFLQFAEEATQAQGIGLGLAIAKKLVELHQGSFLIESIPEKQTIVRITLPSAKDAG
jgi:two-component system sensor histidine kinase/response regulator